jgi:hypothetical protein
MILLTFCATDVVATMEVIMRIPLTPYTITLSLAYCHYYTPNFLAGRCLPATHLRALAEWLGAPRPELRSARAHPLLAIHLALAQAAGLLNVSEGYWQVTPFTLAWLEADRLAQVESLSRALQEEIGWAGTLARLGLEEVFTIDFLAYVAQQLARQQTEPSPPAHATWQSATDWQLHLSAALPPNLLFHLAQMGAWAPGHVWQATPLTISTAAQRGYSLTLMTAVLEKATGKSLSLARQQQLLAWYRQHDAVQVRPVYLLSVKEPAHLDAILAQRRWRRHLGKRLSRRQATISPALLPLLRRWLATQQISLDAPAVDLPTHEMAVDLGYTWLALAVLMGLGQIIELSLAPPAETLFRLQDQLDPAQRADLEQKAQAILAGLRAAIRGRDGYFPQETGVAPEVVATIREAMAREQDLEITYQALGDVVARRRRVEPHRLEEGEQGQYLHGYCYLAQDNRTFRLDRIHSCERRPGEE